MLKSSKHSIFRVIYIFFKKDLKIFQKNLKKNLNKSLLGIFNYY